MCCALVCSRNITPLPGILRSNKHEQLSWNFLQTSVPRLSTPDDTVYSISPHHPAPPHPGDQRDGPARDGEVVPWEAGRGAGRPADRREAAVRVLPGDRRARRLLPGPGERDLRGMAKDRMVLMSPRGNLVPIHIIKKPKNINLYNIQ